jgi:DNA invertase Pin-like site-specific DNA recombinase
MDSELKFVKLNISEKSHYEVSRISSHRTVNNSLEFLVHFKAYSEPCWIADSECNCEHAIKVYFKHNNLPIRTVYCVCRVSTKEQAGFNHVSLEAQEARLIQTATQTYGNEVRIKLLKITASAYKQINSELLNIGEAAQDGDSILVYRVDRLSRNIVKILSFLEDLNDKGVAIFSQDENIWYNKNKLEFIQRIVDANKESEILGKRVRLSLEYRRQRGDEVFGNTAFGYSKKRLENENNRVVKVKDENEQTILKRIRKMKKDGCSSAQITEFLNARGMSKRGKKWTVSMVNYVLMKVI